MSIAVVVAFLCGILAAPLWRMGGAAYGRLVSRRRIARIQAEYAAAVDRLAAEQIRPIADLLTVFFVAETPVQAGCARVTVSGELPR